MSNEFPDNDGLEDLIDFLALKQSRKGYVSAGEKEVLSKLAYSKPRDALIIDASAQVKPSTIYLGSGFGVSNAVKAIGFRLADGTDALGMVNRFSPDSGSRSNPKFYALGGPNTLDVSLADSVIMPSPIEINYTTNGDNLTYSFEVKPASAGRLRGQYWLGDGTGVPVVDFHYDVTQAEVDSGLPITVKPNFYILPKASALFVRFSGISLKGNVTQVDYDPLSANKFDFIYLGW